MRETTSRMVFVAVVGWMSVCLLIASWYPELSNELRILWMISGVTGLVSAVGLSEVIKTDVKSQERLLHEYMQAASMDGLTGLANRQALDRALKSALEGFDSRRNPLTLAMFDIDHFKSINDTHGHQAGDEVLRFVANAAVEYFTGKACVARYGGEEFAIVIPGMRLRNAFVMVDEFRQAIAKSTCRFRDKSLQVTISAGVTEAKNGENSDQVLHRSDLGLYTAKNMGRNCVWFGECSTDTMGTASEVKQHLEPVTA